MKSKKQVLQHLDFSLRVKEALNEVESLLCDKPYTTRSQSIKYSESAARLINEFVFHEVDKIGKPKEPLTHIQQLQLVEILIDFLSYFDNGTDSGDVDLNTVFMSLFPHTCPHRCSHLIKLVALSITTNNIPLLRSAAILMQQIGYTSKFATDLAKGLVDNVFVFFADDLTYLRDLPNKAPLFTANLLTAIGELYFNIDKKILDPPRCVLDLIVYWLQEYHKICFAGITSENLPALPTGTIPMPAIAPFTALFKWCFFAPLCSVCNTDETYGSLHILLLSSIGSLKTVKPAPSTRTIISAPALSTMITSYLLKAGETLQKSSDDIDSIPMSARMPLERLGQFLQISLALDCLYGAKQDLFDKMKQLPRLPVLSPMQGEL